MLNIPVENCCGCTACYSVCPTSAIRMEPDKEGFLYPTVDTDRCCGCKKCEQVCPVLHSPELPESFADCVIARNNSDEVLCQSTSGGFADALCRYVLEECGGYVAGVAFDDEFMPVHKIVNSYEEAKAFRNSKYAQSTVGNVFQDVLTLLKKGETVMFIGIPCQTAGLISYLPGKFENLIAVDLVCRSIPSPKLWREYLRWQEQRHGGKIKQVRCRTKAYGYHSGALEIMFENGRRYRGSNRVDYYMKCFHGDICSRPSCYDCRFKTRHRCSDFTVFDSWKPHLVTDPPVTDDDRGYTNVLVHTEKGREILSRMNHITQYHTDPDKMLSVMGSMIAASIKPKAGRETFYEDLDRYGFYKTAAQYSKVTVKDRLIEAAKPVRHSLKKRFRRRSK